MPVFAPGATDSIAFTVTNTSSIFGINHLKFKFKFFPNPVSKNLNLVCNDAPFLDKNGSLLIYATTGEQLLKYEINSKEMLIDVSQLANGIYLCRIAGNEINEKHWIEIIQ
ncbi:MAG: T9SS type A sorting domain-containing protein [Bacteroidia bacterium]